MTAWPLVCDWLITTSKALWAPVLVLDGPEPTGDSPLVYATVGLSSTSDIPGEFVLTSSEDGLGTYETGHVVGQIVANSGDDFTGPRSTVFGLFDELYAQVSEDQTLGGLLAVTATADVQAQPGFVTNGNGNAFSLALTLTYTTTTWPR